MSEFKGQHTVAALHSEFKGQSYLTACIAILAVALYDSKELCHAASLEKTVYSR